MAQGLDDLTAEVEGNDDVDDSVRTLLGGLSARLVAAVTNPQALKALIEQLHADQDALVAAVTANTPAEDL